MDDPGSHSDSGASSPAPNYPTSSVEAQDGSVSEFEPGDQVPGVPGQHGQPHHAFAPGLHGQQQGPHSLQTYNSQTNGGATDTPADPSQNSHPLTAANITQMNDEAAAANHAHQLPIPEQPVSWQPWPANSALLLHNASGLDPTDIEAARVGRTIQELGPILAQLPPTDGHGHCEGHG